MTRYLSLNTSGAPSTLVSGASAAFAIQAGQVTSLAAMGSSSSSNFSIGGSRVHWRSHELWVQTNQDLKTSSATVQLLQLGTGPWFLYLSSGDRKASLGAASLR